MILKHPLNTQNEANIKAIEKYKDRQVVIEHGLNSLWMGLNGWVFSRSEAETMTFKTALKKTKHYQTQTLIRYHFLSELSETEGAHISEFDAEDVYSCSTVKFDSIESQKLKTSKG